MWRIKKTLFIVCITTLLFLKFCPVIYASATVFLGDSNGLGAFSVVNGSQTTVMTALSNSKIGIGTTTPGAMLDIQGSSAVSSFALNVSGTITVSDGFVGIGTTAPSTELQVVGGVLATSFSGDGSQLTGITNNSFASNIEIVTTGSITAGLGLALANKTFEVDSTGSMTASSITSNGAVVGARLEIANNQFIVDDTGSLTTKNIFVTGSITAKGDITSGGNVSASGNLAVDGDVLFVDSVNDRVGIGTTTPGTVLHLEGGDTWLLPSSSTEGLLVKQTGSGPVVAFRTTTSTAFRIENNNDAWFFGGNVGIGTTTPKQRLVVDGTVVATGVIADSVAVTNGTVTANSFVGNGSGVTGIVSSGISDGQVQTADLQTGINIAAGSITAVTLTTIGSVTATKYAISGDSFVVDNVGSLTATSITSTGGIVSNGTITASGSLEVDGDAFFVDSVSDKIGIGTKTPFTQVHVVGGTVGQSARLALENTSNDEANISFRTPQGDTIILAAGAAGEGWTGSAAGDLILTNRTGGKVSITADTSQGSAPFNVLATGGVGIGTTTSSASVLTVQGTATVLSALDVFGTVTVNDGFVGIGTTTPSTALEVFGTLTATTFSGSMAAIELGVTGTATLAGLKLGALSFPVSDGSANQFLQTDGSGNLAWASSGSVGSVLEGDSSVAVNTGSGNETITFTEDGTQIAIITGGNLGVGTTTPSTKLVVGGTLTVSGNINSTGTTTVAGLKLGSLNFPITDGSANQVLQTDGSGNLSWASSGVSGTIEIADSSIAVVAGSGDETITFTEDGTQTAIITGGKWGIGTTNPSTTLTVDGTVTVNGLVRSTKEREYTRSGFNTGINSLQYLPWYDTSEGSDITSITTGSIAPFNGQLIKVMMMNTSGTAFGSSTVSFHKNESTAVVDSDTQTISALDTSVTFSFSNATFSAGDRLHIGLTPTSASNTNALSISVWEYDTSSE